MQSLANKVYIIMVRGGFKFHVSEKEAQAITTSWGQNDVILLESGVAINVSAIDFVAPASEVKHQERVKSGDWKCKHGYWHTRGQQCGHGILKKNPHLREG